MTLEDPFYDDECEYGIKGGRGRGGRGGERMR